MRYFYFPIPFMLYINSVYSQISIDKNDMPEVDDTFRLSIADITQLDTSLIKVDSTGAGYFWNYSWLEPMEQRVDTFRNPYFTSPFYYPDFTWPFADNEHQATYGLKMPNMEFGGGPYQFTFTDIYEFYRNTSSGFYNVGFGAKVNGFPTTFPSDPTDEVYQFPLEYGDTSTSFSSWGTNMSGFGYYGRRTNRTNFADGWGTLITPYDTFNVLRVKSILEIEDTIYYDSLNIGMTFPRPDQYHYKWLSVNSGVPVLFIEAQSTIMGPPAVDRIEYLDPWKQQIGIAEVPRLESDNFYLFPNPVQKNMTVTVISDELITERTIARIYDMCGRMVKEMKPVIVNKNSISPSLVIDCTGLNPGVYSIELSHPGQLISDHKKLLIY